MMDDAKPIISDAKPTMSDTKPIMSDVKTAMNDSRKRSTGIRFGSRSGCFSFLFLGVFHSDRSARVCFHSHSTPISRIPPLFAFHPLFPFRSYFILIPFLFSFPFSFLAGCRGRASIP